MAYKTLNGGRWKRQRNTFIACMKAGFTVTHFHLFDQKKCYGRERRGGEEFPRSPKFSALLDSCATHFTVTSACWIRHDPNTKLALDYRIKWVRHVHEYCGLPALIIRNVFPEGDVFITEQCWAGPFDQDDSSPPWMWSRSRIFQWHKGNALCSRFMRPVAKPCKQAVEQSLV